MGTKEFCCAAVMIDLKASRTYKPNHVRGFTKFQRNQSLISTFIPPN